MYMFYYYVCDCICWEWTLMDKDYCCRTIYWMYYVIYFNAYTEMVMLIKCAED